MRKLSRRAFLRGGGTALAAAPLAPGLVARLARWYDTQRFWSRAEPRDITSEVTFDTRAQREWNSSHPPEGFNCRCAAEPIGIALNDAEAGELTSVVIGGGLFVAIGSKGEVLTSEEPTGTWTERKV